MASTIRRSLFALLFCFVTCMVPSVVFADEGQGSVDNQALTSGVVPSPESGQTIRGGKVTSYWCGGDTVSVATESGKVFTFTVNGNNVVSAVSVADYPQLIGAREVLNYGTCVIDKDGNLLLWDADARSFVEVEGIGPVDSADRTFEDASTIYLDRVMVASEGSAYVWVAGKTAPEKVEGLSDVKKVATSLTAYAAVCEDGSLWTWGSNYFNLLGDNTSGARTSPAMIMQDVKEIYMNGQYAVAIRRDGTLWLWGGSKATPEQIMDGVETAYPLNGGVVALKTDGSLWNGTSVKLGDNIESFAVGDSSNAMMTKDGTLSFHGVTILSQRNVPLLSWGFLPSSHEVSASAYQSVYGMVWGSVLHAAFRQAGDDSFGMLALAGSVAFLGKPALSSIVSKEGYHPVSTYDVVDPADWALGEGGSSIREIIDRSNTVQYGIDVQRQLRSNSNLDEIWSELYLRNGRNRPFYTGMPILVVPENGRSLLAIWSSWSNYPNSEKGFSVYDPSQPDNSYSYVLEASLTRCDIEAKRWCRLGDDFQRAVSPDVSSDQVDLPDNRLLLSASKRATVSTADGAFVLDRSSATGNLVNIAPLSEGYSEGSGLYWLDGASTVSVSEIEEDGTFGAYSPSGGCAVTVPAGCEIDFGSSGPAGGEVSIANVDGGVFSIERISPDPGQEDGLKIETVRGTGPGDVTVAWGEGGISVAGVTSVTRVGDDGAELVLDGIDANETWSLPEGGSTISIADAELRISENKFTYDGDVKKPEVLTVGGKALKEGTDYTVELSSPNPTSAGEYSLVAVGKGSYAGKSGRATFTIAPASIDNATLSLSQSAFVFDGSAKTPSVTKVGGKKLTQGADFTVQYKDNVNAGTAQATVVGKGNYSGTASAHFMIEQADLTGAKIGLSASSFTYDGKAKEPGVKTVAGRQLVAGADYALSYRGNVNAGTATAVVEGKGNYRGTASAQFRIARASIEGASLSLASASLPYNGGVQHPSVEAVGGRRLKEGVDYTASYSDANSTEVGEYSLSVTGKGNYAGTSSAAGYKIVKAANPAVIESRTLDVDVAKVRKKGQVARAPLAFGVANAQGKVTYKVVKVDKRAKKKVSVSKAGKVRVRKGLKAGRYRVKVRVAVAGTKGYLPAKKTITLTVRVGITVYSSPCAGKWVLYSIDGGENPWSHGLVEHIERQQGSNPIVVYFGRNGKSWASLRIQATNYSAFYDTTWTATGRKKCTVFYSDGSVEYWRLSGERLLLSGGDTTYVFVRA